MDIMRLGYDSNLGLPCDFSEDTGCTTLPYHNLDEMIAALNAKELDSIFIPCGALPYITEYHFCASFIQTNPKNSIENLFCAANDMELLAIPTHSIGRVNKYCTTSFWAPMIYLMESFPPQTSLLFKNTNGFQDLLHKTATQSVDCAMVWDIILKENKKDADQVHELFSSNDLPTPVIILIHWRILK